MKKHKLITAVCTMALTFLVSVTSFAGSWVFDGPGYWQWKYVNDDGTLAAPGWQMIDGKWYHLDENNYLDVGSHTIDGKKYFLSEKSETLGQMCQNVDYLTGRYGEDGAWTDYESINDAYARRFYTMIGNSTLAGQKPWTMEDETRWLGYCAAYNIGPELFVPFSFETLGQQYETRFFIPKENLEARYDILNVLLMQLYMASNTSTFESCSWKTEYDEARNCYVVLTYTHSHSMLFDFCVENWLR